MKSGSTCQATWLPIPHPNPHCGYILTYLFSKLFTLEIVAMETNEF